MTDADEIVLKFVSLPHAHTFATKNPLPVGKWKVRKTQKAWLAIRPAVRLGAQFRQENHS